MLLDEMRELFLASRDSGLNGEGHPCSEKTMRVYKANMNVFVSYYQGDGVLQYSDLSKLQVSRFCTFLESKVKAKEWAPASKYQVLRTVRTFFRWVDREGDMLDQKGNALHGLQRWLPPIPKNPRRLEIPAPAVMKKFRNSFNTQDLWEYRNYIVSCLLMTNGMRIGEVCNLRVDHILWQDGVMDVTGKEGPRLVPITNDMAALLKGWLKRRELCRYAKQSPYVFITKRAPQLDMSGIGYEFRKHCKKHGLPRITPHTFRHYFITHYLGKGNTSLVRLQNITGHKTVQQLVDYAKRAEMRTKTAREELERVNLLKED